MNDNQYTTVINKLDKLDDRLDQSNIILAKQSAVLDEHQRRSVANEQNIELLRQEVRKEVEPLKSFYNMSRGALKLIAGIIALLGVSGALIKFLHLFS